MSAIDCTWSRTRTSGIIPIGYPPAGHGRAPRSSRGLGSDGPSCAPSRTQDLRPPGDRVIPSADLVLKWRATWTWRHTGRPLGAARHTRPAAESISKIAVKSTGIRPQCRSDCAGCMPASRRAACPAGRHQCAGRRPTKMAPGHRESAPRAQAVRHIGDTQLAAGWEATSNMGNTRSVTALPFSATKLSVSFWTRLSRRAACPACDRRSRLPPWRWSVASAD